MFKLIALLFLVSGIIYGIYRFIRSTSSQLRGEKLAAKIRGNNELLLKEAGKMEIMYSKIEIPEADHFHRVMGAVAPNRKLGRYTVLACEKVDKQRYFLVTKCQDVDYGLTVSGKMGDVSQTFHYNFLVIRNEKRNQYQVYSSFTNDRHLVASFGQDLFGMLVPVLPVEVV